MTDPALPRAAVWLRFTLAVPLWTVVIVSVLGGIGTSSLGAQTTQVGFDRPEAWGMKYGTSLSIFTGFGAPRETASGEVELGFEMGHVPEVSDSQRRIGFNGTKLEDMNKTPVFGRIRAGVGVGGGWKAEMGLVPPVEVDGATPLMASVSLGGPLYTGSAVRFGVRGYGHVGRFGGDITCDAETVAAGPDPVRNEFNCESVSDDDLRQRFVGAELSGALPFGVVEPYATVALNYLDTSFQVRATYAGTRSEELLETSGVTVSGTVGVVIALTESVRLSTEAFYSPLDVVRPPATVPVNDGMFNLRALLSYRLR